MNEKNNENRILVRITVTSFLGNVFLAGFKLIAGIFGKSVAMISDSIHSFSHVFTTVIALAGVKAGQKEPDEKHPYGHERMECIASIALGLILVYAAFLIARNGIVAIVTKSYLTTEVPGAIAVIGAVASILVNEGMYLYIKYYAQKINSPAFMAAAIHDHADSLSSVGSLVGITGAMIGFPIMDSLAALVICGFLFQSAYEILKEAFEEMLDVSCGKDFEKRLNDYILEQSDSVRIDNLKTRKFGSKKYVDLEIEIDGNCRLREVNRIAGKIHDNVEKEFPDIKHITIQTKAI